MPRQPYPPNQIFRERDAKIIFGYAPTVLKAKIEAGVIPKPKLLSPPPSRARGWFGYQVNEYHNRIDNEQADWEREAADGDKYYQPKPPPRKKTTATKRRKAVQP